MRSLWDIEGNNISVGYENTARNFIAIAYLRLSSPKNLPGESTRQERRRTA